MNGLHITSRMTRPDDFFHDTCSAPDSTQRPDALLERHVAAGTVREDFQRLVSVRVSTGGSN
jgi:hypothetical protein